MKTLPLLALVAILASSLFGFVPVGGAVTPITITGSYSILGGGSPTAPTLNYYNQTNALTHKSLTQTPKTYSAYPGSAWTVTPDPLTGSGATQRWIANTAVSGTATTAFALALSFFHQYNESAKFSTPQSPINNNPYLHYYAFGVAASGKLNLAKSTLWADAGTSWTVDSPFTTYPNFDVEYANATTGLVSAAKKLLFVYAPPSTAQKCPSTNPLTEILNLCVVSGIIDTWSAPFGSGTWLTILLLGVNVAIWNKTQYVLMAMITLLVTGAVFAFVFPVQFGNVADALVAITVAALFVKLVLLGR